MKRVLIALVGLCLALAATEDVAFAWPRVDPASVSETQGFALRDAVRQELEQECAGVYFAIIAEVERGDVRACLVWPALYRGKFLDDDIVAYAFRRDGQRWVPTKGSIKLSSGDGRERLVELVGGADYRVIKPDGLPIRELSSHLTQGIERLRRALEHEQFRDAIDAIESLSRAFSLNMAAFDDTFAEALIEHSSVHASLDINRFAPDKEDAQADSDMTIVIRDPQGNLLGEIRLQVRLVRIGSGWAIDYVKVSASGWPFGGSQAN